MSAARREPAPRRSHRAALTLIAIGVLASAGVLGGRWLLHEPFLSVEHVTVTGAHHESTVAILDALGVAAHPAMIDETNAAVASELRVFPWITRVRVVRHWPNTLDVTLRETVAVAVAFDHAHALRYVDARGVDLGPAPLDANLPTLVARPSTSTWPFEGEDHAAVVVASRLPRAFADQVRLISEVHGDVALTMTTPVTFELGPTSDLHAKFVAIASIIKSSASLNPPLHAGDTVNVSVPGEVAVSGPGAP